MNVLERAALLPEPFARWFASRGWTPRAHQLELLAKAQAGRSALLIAPTGAGKTLAGFLPSLVELSGAPFACALPPPCGGGLGWGRWRERTSVARPTPIPSPKGRGAGCGGRTLRLISTGRDVRRAAACTRSTSRRSRRSRSTSRAISKRRSPRWSCRSASRPAPATRRPRSASASAAIRRTSCSPRRSSLRCCSRRADGPFLFGSLRRVVLDELHALVTSKRGDLLSLGLARLYRLAPQLTSVGLSATVAEPDDLCRFLVPQRDATARADLVIGESGAAPDVAMLDTARAAAVGRPLGAPRARRNLRPDQGAQDHAHLRQHAQPGREHLPGALAHQRRQSRDRAASRLARCRAAPQGRGRDDERPPARGGVHLLARSRRRLGRCRSRHQCRRAQGRLAAPAAHRPRQPPHGRALEGRAGAGEPLRSAGMPRRARRHRRERAGHAAIAHRRARRAGAARARLRLRRAVSER